jgi:ferric-dicitrate binding protein FerR (iron transport regulator)
MRESESREHLAADQEAIDRVALLLDADLEPEERRRLTAAVASDAEFRRHYREIEAAWELLDAFPGIEIPVHAEHQVLEQARAELTRERQGRLVRMALGWVAAAGIFLAVFLGIPGERPGRGNLANGGQDYPADDGFYARASDFDFEDF